MPLPCEFEGLYALYEGKYWAIHDVDEDGYVWCYQWETKQQKDIHMSKLEFQYARRIK
ncbi:hypothetical protein MycrhDRAFT_5780 [Mycolicibacterium rhodesiae JS60]|nr:hypothetical protein MycrhDRAFT_5780 [Mycolicibacterium rhodesiae JS60]